MPLSFLLVEVDASNEAFTGATSGTIDQDLASNRDHIRSEVTEISRLIATALVIVMLSASATATPLAASESELHTVRCVAGLDVNTRELAELVKGGRDQLRPVLLGRLVSGAAFIGRAYLAGERDKVRIRMLLDTALDAQKALPESLLVARQTACNEEGAQLTSDANVIERAVVYRVAEKRMNQLLAE